MSRDALLAWGWRIPFLLSVVLVGLGLYVRLRVEETPVFRCALAQHGRSRWARRSAATPGRSCSRAER